MDEFAYVGARLPDSFRCSHTCIVVFHDDLTTRSSGFFQTAGAWRMGAKRIKNLGGFDMAGNQNQGGQNQGGQGNQNQGRGFASMDENKQREIASEGGRAAHESGNAHEFSSEEAREAGRKGGKAAHESGNAHEFDSEEAREAGRKGGEAVSRDREHMSEIGSQGGASRRSGSSGDSGGSGNEGSRGGSHEQHVKAGQQSHKNK
jgi:general stress protein YciG